MSLDNNIINFEEEKKKKAINLTVKDIFNIFIVKKHIAKDYFNINLDLLMKSLGKYAGMNKFSDIYGNLTVTTDSDNMPIIDLTNVYQDYIAKKILLEDPRKKHEFVIIATEEDLDKLKDSYSDEVYYLTDSLFFNVFMDLEHGLNGWDLLFEDEYIKVPGYPGIVTGEFIGRKRTRKIKKEIKKRAQEKLKREYED